MILERAAAYVLAVVFLFQPLRPSWTITSQCWRSINIHIGWLRVQARNGVNSVCFEQLAGEKEQRASSSERRTLMRRDRVRDFKRLRICLDDSGCMTAWWDGISHWWSVSNDREDNFEESSMGLDGHQMSSCRD